MPPPPDPFHVLRTHSAPLSSLAFSSNNAVLYSGDQEGWVSITDLRTRRSIVYWKAHEGGILGVGEWDGRLISHGRDNSIHIYERIPLIRRAGQINLKSGPSASPAIWKSLSVNSLNFCPFALLPVPFAVSDVGISTEREAEALLSVPNLMDTELVDVYHLPSMKRLHAGVNTVADGKGKGKAKAGPADATRSGLVMSIHLRFIPSSVGPEVGSSSAGGDSAQRLVAIMGYEDGRVDMWGMSGESEGEGGDTRVGRMAGKEEWRSFSDGSGQVGKRRWEVLWSGKGHNEAIMAMTVSSDARYAYTVSADHLLVKYDLEASLKSPRLPSTDLIHPYSTKQIGNASIAISSSDAIVAVGGWDGKVRLFSATSGKPLGTLGYHRETVQCLAFPKGGSGGEEGDELVEPEASTIELGEEDSDDEDEEDEMGAKGRRDWFVSGGKDRRVALWELMDFSKGG